MDWGWVGTNHVLAISHISNLGTLITFSVRDTVSLPVHPQPIVWELTAVSRTLHKYKWVPRSWRGPTGPELRSVTYDETDALTFRT